MLKILSGLYGCVAGLRNILYDKKILQTTKVNLPVICVGNLSAGGNGKTPLVHFICQSLLQRGIRPAVLSRGYGGSIKGPYLVSPQDLASQVSDEALLLCKYQLYPIVIASKRVAGAKFIEQQKLADVIVMDDGFQHRKLYRDINIISINLTNLEDTEDFLAGQLLPLGRFREDRTQGIKRADLVVLSNRSVKAIEQKNLVKVLNILPQTLPVFKARLTITKLSKLDDNLMELNAPAKIVAFCAIANPEGFFLSLESLGFTLCAKLGYPDHHHFTWSEIKSLQSTYPELALVCTAKDAVKLDPSWGAPIYVLNTQLKIEPEDAFVSQIFKLIESKSH